MGKLNFGYIVMASDGEKNKYWFQFWFSKHFGFNSAFWFLTHFGFGFCYWHFKRFLVASVFSSPSLPLPHKINIRKLLRTEKNSNYTSDSSHETLSQLFS